MIQLYAKRTKRPRLFAKRFDIFELVTGDVPLPSGKTRTVTMEGWFWNNLDWIHQNTWTNAQSLVHIAEQERGSAPLDHVLKVGIWQFICTYDEQRMARAAAEQVGLN